LKKKPVVRVVTATEAKNRFGDLIRGAYLREEHLIVKRDGIPVVAIVPMTDYERLVNPADLPDDVSDDVQASIKAVRARARLLDILDEASQELPEVSEEEVETDVTGAIHLSRSRITE
jgi:prevent-host-death family protein